MECSIDIRSEKDGGSRKAFRRRQPRVASVGNGLVLVSSGFQKRRSEKEGALSPAYLRARLEALSSRDVKVAVDAANSLIRAGGRAVPGLLERLKDRGAPSFKRALFVLHNIDWRVVEARHREKAIEQLTPILFTFNRDRSRTSSSLISQDIILKMGQDALPFFAILLRSSLPAARMLGLSALLEVKWTGMPYTNVGIVEDALEGLLGDATDAFRQAAGVIQRRIRSAYILCRDSGPALWAGEGGADVPKAG